ncbi:helix-turn-helix transcriptional regulator [Streptomyces sp. RLA2-12]|nr:helix-turn-helix transcriptional regulator [Streptomyces sp. RLA2-12]
MVRQVRAVRTRRALVRAAAEVFAEDGYALASLPVISRRAGVSTGALHFHFPSKDLLAREVEAAATVSVQRLVVREGAGGGGLQLLVDVSRDLVAALAVDPVLRAGFELGGDPSRKSAEGPGRWWCEWVHALLREAQGAGELARGCPRRRRRWRWWPRSPGSAGLPPVTVCVPRPVCWSSSGRCCCPVSRRPRAGGRSCPVPGPPGPTALPGKRTAWSGNGEVKPLAGRPRQPESRPAGRLMCRKSDSLEGVSSTGGEKTRRPV